MGYLNRNSFRSPDRRDFRKLLRCLGGCGQHCGKLGKQHEHGKIQISEKTSDYLEGDGELTDRGQINLKGKGSFKTFFLESLNK